MKNDKLTPAQLEALRPLERNFRQATDAAWCSYPGKDNIDMMLGIWKELTGQNYPYQPGCGNCLLNLVRDFGHLYFAQKPAEIPAEPAETPVEETKAPQTPKPSPAKKKPAKSKKK